MCRRRSRRDDGRIAAAAAVDIEKFMMDGMEAEEKMVGPKIAFFEWEEKVSTSQVFPFSLLTNVDFLLQCKASKPNDNPITFSNNKTAVLSFLKGFLGHVQSLEKPI